MRSETILIVDDEKLIRWSLSKELSEMGFIVIEAESVKTTFQQLQKYDPDIALLDHNLPDGTGIEILQALRQNYSVIPTILMTATDRSNVAVQALKLGAVDYLIKPINIEELILVIEKTLEQSQLRRQVQHLLKTQEAQFGGHKLIGTSEKINSIFDQISKIVQSSSSTVLITGESGTGKEMIARAIHSYSDRKDKPFVVINCSTLTDSIIESDLFGHEKGAFTDAKKQRRGLFEVANGGTIFLDEIGELESSLQVKLLRVLDDRSFRRVGGTIDISINVRIIAATNKILEILIEEGKFRSDLFYRLNVVRIHVPPLRERREDILLLAEYFLQYYNVKLNKQFKGLTADCKKIFMNYPWPGNIRELRNAIERAVILDDGEYIFSHSVTIGHFHEFPEPKYQHKIEIGIGETSLLEIEKQTLIEALKQSKNNQTKAARILKISRDTLRYRMKKHNL